MSRAAARFDSASQHRRVLLAKVHIARKDMGLDEDTYRGVLSTVAPGISSAGECTEAQLDAVLAHFRTRGWHPAPRAGKRAPRAADHPSARKARTMWISLHHLNVVRSAAEAALEAFAARQLGCEKMQWANQSDCYRLIEALKSMAERAGWSQRSADGAALGIEQLQEGLCRAIFARLEAAGAVRAGLSFDLALFEIGGHLPARPLDRMAYRQVAAELGRRLRATQDVGA